MGISHGSASPVEPLLLTPMGEACLRMDLTAIHEILEKAGYKDDEGIANEVIILFLKVLLICQSRTVSFQYLKRPEISKGKRFLFGF